MRAVDGLMATGGPAGAALNKRRVVTAADQKLPGGCLLLIMTLQTERLIPGFKHLVIHRPVRVVTCGAIVPQRFMFEDIRTALRFMTRETGVVCRGEFGAATNHRVAFVRIMTIGTGYLAHRMRMRQCEFPSLIRVTLETRARIRRRINNVVRTAAGLGVDAARTVTGLAANVFAGLP